jgi:flagellar hook assembly protein FlgD
VLIKINNEPGEFTFSDSLGNFQYKLPAGIYDVYAERVFYEDVIQYEIEVLDGQFTQIQIPMFEIVGVTQNQVPNTQCQLTNFPNPFNPETTIEFTIPTDSKVEIKVFNIKGQKVKQLLSNSASQLSAGKHSITWDGTDSNNKPVSSGIYLYKISSGNESVMKKMLLLK